MVSSIRLIRSSMDISPSGAFSFPKLPMTAGLSEGTGVELGV